MRETTRAALTASLAALERMIETLWAIAPARSEFADDADKEAASRLTQLLLQAASEASRLRARVRLPLDVERVEIGCVPVDPV
ncbi:MAG: hypothetical protein KF889_18580 [Alphaproteobacteria bacterium]|nr:hypothetical protein [Alphaproteobacteria bacterium]MCW5743925.1 hypothetical protein [Alphaproteobacteria bacterium]